MENPQELLVACIHLLDRVDNMTSDEFARGGERREREELRQVLCKQYNLHVSCEYHKRNIEAP